MRSWMRALALESTTKCVITLAVSPTIGALGTGLAVGHLASVFNSVHLACRSERRFSTFQYILQFRNSQLGTSRVHGARIKLAPCTLRMQPSLETQPSCLFLEGQ